MNKIGFILTVAEAKEFRAFAKDNPAVIYKMSRLPGTFKLWGAVSFTTDTAFLYFKMGWADAITAYVEHFLPPWHL
jgi:hypothetical protein